jgi:CRISPR-associated endonuclease Cas1/CRISPR-associated protein Cas4
METEDLIPARMVNEFVYCPRLFWLEHVEGVFVDNEHTIRGQHTHRAVDKPGGKLAAPRGKSPSSGDENNPEKGESDESIPWHARSLHLSNASLGVTARLDYVEEDSGYVVPVDTKKGRSRDGSLWPSDRVQLTLQALLLRSHGFQCAEISAFYAEERRRVTEPLTDEAIAWAQSAIAGARACAEGTSAPPPLVDSPKCPGCSLNVICLPDEANFLAGRDPDVARRIVPVRDDALPVYVQSPRASVGLQASCLKITSPGANPDTKIVGLPQISQVCLFGGARITMPALQECMRREIPVSLFSTGGWYYGAVDPVENRQVHVRVAQFREAESERGLEIARRIVADKIANQRTIIRRNAASSDRSLLRRLEHSAKRALDAPDRETLLGLEGSAAREFWGAYSTLFTPEWRPRGRTRRPPEDPVNAMLSFAYALLVKDCRLAVRTAGLDPFYGVFHTAHHGRPSLALDLMEPFRPLVADSVVLLCVKRGEVRENDFIKTGQAVAMNQRARRALIRAYERRMDELLTHPTFGYRISYRQTIHVQARLLARVLSGELDQLPALRTR